MPESTNDGVYCTGILAPGAATEVARGTSVVDLAATREASGGTTIMIGGLTLLITVLA